MSFLYRDFVAEFLYGVANEPKAYETPSHNFWPDVMIKEFRRGQGPRYLVSIEDEPGDVSRRAIDIIVSGGLFNFGPSTRLPVLAFIECKRPRKEGGDIVEVEKQAMNAAARYFQEFDMKRTFVYAITTDGTKAKMWTIAKDTLDQEAFVSKIPLEEHPQGYIDADGEDAVWLQLGLRRMKEQTPWPNPSLGMNRPWLFDKANEVQLGLKRFPSNPKFMYIDPSGQRQAKAWWDTDWVQLVKREENKTVVYWRSDNLCLWSIGCRDVDNMGPNDPFSFRVRDLHKVVWSTTYRWEDDRSRTPVECHQSLWSLIQYPNQRQFWMNESQNVWAWDLGPPRQ